MSTTLPPTEPASTPKQAIISARSASDVIQAAGNDPQLLAAFQAAFSTQITAAQKNPYAMLIGLLAGWLGSRYGFAVDPQIATVIGLVSMVGLGDLSQWISARWPAKPTGVTP